MKSDQSRDSGTSRMRQRDRLRAEIYVEQETHKEMSWYKGTSLSGLDKAFFPALCPRASPSRV